MSWTEQCCRTAGSNPAMSICMGRPKPLLSTRVYFALSGIYFRSIRLPGTAHAFYKGMNLDKGQKVMSSVQSRFDSCRLHLLKACSDSRYSKSRKWLDEQCSMATIHNYAEQG